MHEYTAVVSESAAFAKEALGSQFDVIFLPRDRSIALPVSSHPDMIMFSQGNSLVVPIQYYEVNREVIDLLCGRCDLELTLSNAERSKEYPHDVSLNVLLCDDAAFSLKEHTADEVKDLLRNHSIELYRVKQGYSACSTLSLGGAAVTADRSISKAAREHGIDVLEISHGNIVLEGYNEGFIGGASGVCGNTVYFLGNIDTHPDSEKIRGFLKIHGFECASLGDGNIRDCGGIKFFRNIH